MILIKAFVRKVSMGYSSKKLKASFIIMILIAISLGISGQFIGVGKTTETGETIKLLDVMFNRSEAATYTQIKAYGKDGRTLYFYSTLILDSIFPMAFGTFLTLLLVNLFKKSRSQIAILTPLLVVFTDFAENILTAIMLTNYPVKLYLISYAGSLFTSLKWIFMGIVILLIALGLINKKREGRKGWD